eukprot:Nk52_evm1s529 gene=Nk52_evmTU1s529
MVKVYKLSRTSAHRKALFRNLMTDLIRHERIETTLQKAKAVKPQVEKLITYGKKGQQSHINEAKRVLFDHSLLPKLFGPLAQRYGQKDGNYTRIMRIPDRKCDSAQMAVIELVNNEFPPLRPSREELVAMREEQKKEQEAQLDPRMQGLSPFEIYKLKKSPEFLLQAVKYAPKQKTRIDYYAEWLEKKKEEEEEEKYR